MSMKKYLTRLVLVFLCVNVGLMLTAIIANAQTISKKDDNGNAVRSVFNDVENGIINNDIDLIAQHFSKQISLSVPGTESGFYSANQSISILRNYFNYRHNVSFILSTRQLTGEIPYATGAGYNTSRGKRESFQIYTALKRAHGVWIITQFNVY
jgi:hypothetical protein